jgi:hypothetical protein
MLGVYRGNEIWDNDAETNAFTAQSASLKKVRMQVKRRAARAETERRRQDTGCVIKQV